MTNGQYCPLCAETYDDRTDLRVHLEVEHRKSELVAELVDRRGDDRVGSAAGDDPMTADEERPAPSAD
ncbi:hypothetical protein GS429_01240 [Natronorubrum sp. JWXQ-INN-674]|uniref:C2H2-type domain-containing protein n=1 Tax=Natronorubrum halalkaliphilum TaxID=2691917 RepID=A0A6B0VI31_9EURY|nr:hypothetical protein [Natronorubrum halalkaliphilum]MXV60715.1 hypothetical protein [Natronorubrum halalkaliphilum]